MCWSLRWWFWLVCSSLCNILLQKKKKNRVHSVSVSFVFFIQKGVSQMFSSVWLWHSTNPRIQDGLATCLWAWGWRLSFPPPCRKMWAICSSGWRRSWPPLRGSLMCSLWSLGSEYTPKSFACLNRDANMTHDITAISKPLPPPAASHPICSHVSLRLEDCSSDVPLLPREVLVFLSSKLWDSAVHLSVGEHSGSTPHPLLLIKFFIIVCRWGLPRY